MSFWLNRQQMGWAAVIMGGSVLLSRFAGLIRDKVISYTFGATLESDIYFAAFVIPDFINYLLAGAYFSITLIPLLAERFQADRDDGWRFFSAIVTWVGLAAAVLTGAAMIAAPSLAQLAAPGLGPDGWQRLAAFLRIVLPAQVCFLLGSCFTALLYMEKQFLVPALSPLIYNGFIIAGGLLLKHRGMEGFCWGVLAGALLGNLALPWLAARQAPGFRLRMVFRDSGLKRFFRLALPLMIGQSVVVLDEQLIRVFGSLAGSGAISRLNYARRIMLVPVGVVAQAAGVASYPFLAERIARGDRPGFDRTLNSALRNTLVLIVPVSVWMALAAKPTMLLIFQQGRFAAADTADSAWLLVIFLSAVAAWAVQQIIGRGFYAVQDTVTPAVIGTLATLAALPVYYLASQTWQAAGVALASALAVTLYALALGLRWRYRHGGGAFTGLGRDLARVLALSAAAALGCVPVLYLLPMDPSGAPYLVAFAQMTASAAVFGSILIAASLRFCPDLVQPFIDQVRRRTRRRSNPSGPTPI